MALLLVVIASLLVGLGAGIAWARSKATGDTRPDFAVAKEQLRHAEARIEYLEAELTNTGHRAAEFSEAAAVLRTQLDNAQVRLAEQKENDEVMLARVNEMAKGLVKETREEVQRSNRDDFDKQQLQIQGLVKPVQQNLDKLEQLVARSDKERNEQFGGLFEQMLNVGTLAKDMQTEAAALKNVLNSSTTARGQWGELSLHRVVELAGMKEHVDFVEQTSVTTDDGRSRADMIVHLPGGFRLAIDAKVPFTAFADSHAAEDQREKERLLKEHSKAFRGHIDALAKRKYWEQYAPSPNFAILFVPGDALLDAALMHDPLLSEFAAEGLIYLATPSTLIPMLRMAALGWAQQSQADNAAEIAQIGRELLKRLVKADDHLNKMGRNLSTVVKSYNDFVGSFDSRVKPQANKLSKLSGAEAKFEKRIEVSEHPRELRQQVFEEIEVQVLELDEHSDTNYEAG